MPGYDAPLTQTWHDALLGYFGNDPIAREHAERGMLAQGAAAGIRFDYHVLAQWQVWLHMHACAVHGPVRACTHAHVEVIRWPLPSTREYELSPSLASGCCCGPGGLDCRRSS